MNERAGVKVTIVAHRDAEDSVRRGLDVYPIFARTNWDDVYAHPKAWRRYVGIARHNWLVYLTMNRFVQEHGPFDCLFAPTVVIYQLAGWRLLMARHGGRAIKRMVLLFRNNAGSYSSGSSVPQFKRSTAILKWAIQSFAPYLRDGRVEFATDSGRLASEYDRLSGITPTVYPSPRIAPPVIEGHRQRNPDKPITFSCLGPARFEKGIDVIQEAIRCYLQANADAHVRFVIQWNADILDEKGAVYQPDPALQADPRVHFIRRPMSSEEYDRAVADTDIMLLPYRRESYFARISGVAVEAVTAGIPVIYTEDTWCEELVTKSGAGIGVKNNDAAALCDAIGKAVRDFDRLRELAVAHAEKARQAHSGEAFLAKLWALA